MIISPQIDAIIGWLFWLWIACVVFFWVSAGRCNRREYIIAFFITPLLLYLIIEARPVVGYVVGYRLVDGVYLAVVFFWIGVCVRRFHDIDLSGWYVLLLLVPVINIITQLYLLLKKGKETTRWS